MGHVYSPESSLVSVAEPDFQKTHNAITRFDRYPAQFVHNRHSGLKIHVEIIVRKDN